MKRMVCEMCGSNDMVKQDGLFVCQNCETKYSVEEARKLMIEVEGTVRVDNTHMIPNYLEMALAAKDAGNNQEAENYCNKVIEIEPTNYKAWMLKGESAAWQSTLLNSRVDEGVAAFVKGITNAPEEEKEELIEQAKQQIKNLSSAMISLRAERFVKWPDEEEATGFLSDITAILGSVINFLSGTGSLIPIAEIMAPIATQINGAVTLAWEKVIWPDYDGDPYDPDDRAGKHEWQTFIKRADYCINLLEKAINLCDEDDEEDIIRYKNLIFISKAAIESCSWDYNLMDNGGRSWHKEWHLTDDSVKTRVNWIESYEDKISEIKQRIAAKETAEKAEKARQRAVEMAKEKEEAKKRFDDYWEAHADERKELEAEQKALKDQINSLTASIDEQDATLKKEIAAIPGKDEIENLDARIKKLSADIAALGIFKGKEKLVLQGQIDQAKVDKKAVQKKMSEAKADLEANAAASRRNIQVKISQLQSRVKSIYNELTMER